MSSGTLSQRRDGLLPHRTAQLAQPARMDIWREPNNEGCKDERAAEMNSLENTWVVPQTVQYRTAMT